MRYLALTVLAALSLSAPADGQDVSPMDVEAASFSAMSEADALRAELGAELAELRQRVDAMSARGGGGCGGSCCDPCCRGQGWYGSAQAVWLKPHHADGPGVAAQGLNLDTDFEVTPRLELGLARSDGLGFRVRYWEFEHDFNTTFPGPILFSTAWDTWVGDIEVTKSTKLGCNWDATVAVGLRHVDYAERVAFGDVVALEAAFVEETFDGTGLTVAVEVRRCVSCNWGLFGNARASAVYGDETLDFLQTEGGMITDVTFEQLNNVKYIWEAQAGVEWTRPIPCGGYWYARAFGEVQYWDAFGLTRVAEDPPVDLLHDTSLGFAGFGVSLGVVR